MYSGAWWFDDMLFPPNPTDCSRFLRMDSFAIEEAALMSRLYCFSLSFVSTVMRLMVSQWLISSIFGPDSGAELFKHRKLMKVVPCLVKSKDYLVPSQLEGSSRVMYDDMFFAVATPARLYRFVSNIIEPTFNEQESTENIGERGCWSSSINRTLSFVHWSLNDMNIMIYDEQSQASTSHVRSNGHDEWVLDRSRVVFACIACTTSVISGCWLWGDNTRKWRYKIEVWWATLAMSPGLVGELDLDWSSLARAGDELEAWINAFWSWWMSRLDTDQFCSCFSTDIEGEFGT